MPITRCYLEIIPERLMKRGFEEEKSDEICARFANLYMARSVWPLLSLVTFCNYV